MSFKWGQVSTVTPLTVIEDGSSNALPVIQSLVDPSSLTVGDMVRVELAQGGRVVVYGLPGGDPRVGVNEGDIAASQITSGVLDDARIPSLPASQITSGVLDDARLPDRLQDTQFRTISGSNMNNVLETGWYSGSGMSNAPGGSYYYVMVINYNSGYTHQLAWTLIGSIPQSYMRQKLNNSWTSWQRFITEDDGSTKINDVTISGYDVRGNGDLRLFQGPGYGTLFRLRSDGSGEQVLSKSVYNRTYSSSANMYVTSYGTIGRSTSSRRYKISEEPAPLDWGDKFLTLQPKTWHDKATSEAMASLLTRQGNGETIDWDDEDIPALVRNPGFIAEEVHAAGLTEFVLYDTNGAPDALAYPAMIAAAQQAMVNEREKRIELEAKYDALLTRVEALEAN